jgi:hypothetical protein
VLAVVRNDLASGEEFVDLSTVRFHAEGVEAARAAREQADRVAGRVWCERNPSVRVGRFELRETERP